MARAPWANNRDGDEIKKREPVKLTKDLDKADYIWNANWQEEMERLERVKLRKNEQAEKAARGPSGFLNLGRTQELNMLETSLEDKRLKNLPSEAEKSVLESREAMKSVFTSDSQYSLRGWKYAPTRGEKKRWQSEWEKASRFSQGGTMSELSEKAATEASAVDREEKRQAYEEEYKELKNRLFLATAAVGVTLTVGAYAWKGLDTGASLGAGVVFALLYLRLLSKQVEGMSGGGGGPSPPSFIVPVLVVLIFKRWNQLYAEDFGVTAELLPMLLGFFSYKVSTILEAFFSIAKENNEPLPQYNPATGRLEKTQGDSFELNLPPVKKATE